MDVRAGQTWMLQGLDEAVVAVIHVFEIVSNEPYEPSYRTLVLEASHNEVLVEGQTLDCSLTWFDDLGTLLMEAP